MTKDLEIWQFALEKLQQQESVTLLVVAESSGSSPGRQGFKMIVAEDELCGSIGGGVMEVRLVQDLRFKIQDSNLIEQVHRKDVPNTSGMICSGKQTIIIFELNQSHLQIIKKIIQYTKNKRERYLQISSESFQLGWQKFYIKNFIFKKSESDFFYREKIGFKNNLFIIGGGHCALALSEIMSKMDFHITVFDDRPNLNTLEKNKFAHRVEIIESYDKIGEFVPSGKDNYVVVMTLGYKFDETVIRQLFNKNFKYFGVLGSKAKMKTLLKALENEGFDKGHLSKIHSPIGLPINSHTPEEIAVSIAAEIIKVKNS
jgi:xanthine dehydrogenase accessory factor